MSTTNNEIPAGWTLMNTSRTWTTSYGGSHTCTLADAMRNRTFKQVNNLAQCFAELGLALKVAAMAKASKPRSRRKAR